MSWTDSQDSEAVVGGKKDKRERVEEGEGGERGRGGRELPSSSWKGGGVLLGEPAAMGLGGGMWVRYRHLQVVQSDLWPSVGGTDWIWLCRGDTSYREFQRKGREGEPATPLPLLLPPLG